jgi:crossover junction endodeoxyribonuclease RusA
MKLVLDVFPPSLNKLLRMHWAARRRTQSDYNALVVAYRIQQRVPEATGRQRVSITFYWPNRRRKDPDNYAKVLCDALTHAGLILDDSPAWAEITTRFEVDRANPRIEIELEEYPWPAGEDGASPAGSSLLGGGGGWLPSSPRESEGAP